jgi:hypothetical protein
MSFFRFAPHLLFALPLFTSSASAVTYWSWRDENFIFDPSLEGYPFAGHEEDPDWDGLPNLLEYAFGGDPWASDSAAFATSYEMVSGQWAFSFNQRLNATDLFYAVRSSTDLTYWVTFNAPIILSTQALADPAFQRVSVLPPEQPSSHIFFRLRVQTDPPLLTAPEDLSVSVSTAQNWILRWTDPNTTETQHRIQRLVDDTWQDIGVVEADTNRFTHLTANRDDSITYRVSALGTGSEEAFTMPFTLPDSDGDTIPDAFELGASYAGQAGFTNTFASAYSSGDNELSDAWWINQGLDPFALDGQQDSDGDGMSDGREIMLGTDPSTPHPGWTSISLPSDLTPVLASPLGTAVLHDGTKYWRWRFGTLTDLGPRADHSGDYDRSSVRINNRGDIAILRRTSFSAPFGTTPGIEFDSAVTYQLTVHPWDGSPSWSYAPSSLTRHWDATRLHEFVSDPPYPPPLNSYYPFVRWWRHRETSNWHYGGAPFFLDEQGRLWLSAVKRVYARDYTYWGNPTHGEEFGTDIVRVSAAGEVLVRAEATLRHVDGAETPAGMGQIPSWIDGLRTHFVGADAVAYIPWRVNRSGEVIGYDLQEHDNFLYKPGSAPVALGNSALFPSYYWDSQGRICIESEVLPGTHVPRPYLYSLVTPNGPYRRLPFEALPLPEGWSSDHKIPPGSQDAQLGVVSINGAPPQPFILLPTPARLLVDANRDGELGPTPTLDGDLTTPAKPFRFASNDDDDSPGSTPQADYSNAAVDGADDLPDLFPVFLDIKQLLGVIPHTTAGITYKLKQADDGLNFVYTSLTRATAFDYLTDTASTYGPNAGQTAANATTQQITADGAPLDAAFLTRIKDQDQGVILLELRKMTAAPLRLVVEKADGTEIAAVAVNIATGEIEWVSQHTTNPVEEFNVPAYYSDYTTKPLAWLEGLRYFSDGEDEDASFNRTRINVKVKMAGAAGKSINIKAFDVDDSTHHDWDPDYVIDPNDTATTRTGNDNVTVGGVLLNGIFIATGTREATAVLDSNGEAVLELITSARPGSNFRIATVLSDAADQLDALQVISANAPRYVAPDAKPVPGFVGVTSPTLTIWRKLHIEVDSMEAAPDPIPENRVTGTITSVADDQVSFLALRIGLDIGLPGEADRFEYGNMSVAGVDLLVRANTDETLSVFKAGGITATQLVGQRFTLTDDDNRFNALHSWQELPLHDTHMAVLRPVRAKYAPAFIEIIDANAAGLNPNRTVTFKLNESPVGGVLPLIPNVYDNAIDIEGTRYFWAHALVFGLQPEANEDGDPYAEGLLKGSTPYTFSTFAAGWEGMGYSAIYIESNREDAVWIDVSDLVYTPARFLSAESIAERSRKYTALLAGTISHEIGHGPTAGENDDHSEGGLMQSGGADVNTDFSAASLLRFRNVSEWK